VQRTRITEPKIPSLPDTAQIIADVIGRDATLKLASVAKHRAIYIPKNMPPSHWVVSIVGPETAKRLVQKFGGELLVLAKCANIARHERDTRIARAKRAGLTDAQIAAAVRVHVRTVRNVLARLKGGQVAR